jgi:hypothetical protein
VELEALGGALEVAVTGSRLGRTVIAAWVIDRMPGVTQAGIRGLDW